MKSLLILAAAMILIMGCGGQKVPVSISNGLGAWDIHEIYISPHNSDEWGNNLISEVLTPGNKYETSLSAGEYDFKVVDEDGDSFLNYEVEVKGDSFTWEVTMEYISW